MSETTIGLIIFILTTISVSAFGIYILKPDLLKTTRFRQRYNNLAKESFETKSFAEIEQGRKWKRNVEKTLLEIDEKQRTFSRDTSKLTLTTRMRQAGLFWTKKDYLTICIVTGVGLLIALSAMRFSVVFSFLFACVGSAIFPYMMVGRLRKRRFKRFSIEFTNAVDMIARGLKSGLPIGECIVLVSNEAAEPVKTEFKQLNQDLTLGLPMDVAVHRFADRTPLSETNYFSIVVGSQTKTGGSLSEALFNLSKMLRDRRNMHEKIRAMSAEAIVSAVIIGFIPFFVGGVVYFASPDYLSLLYTTQMGQLTLILSALWMTIGILVIYKMVNFDF